MAKTSSRDTQKKPPKVVIWLESSITALHTMHMAMMSRALQTKGFDVSIITSEDTIKFFEKNGGKLTKEGYCDPDSSIDFGSKAHFLTPLVSQESYSKPGVPQNNNHALRPFNFIGSPPIAEQRNQAIARLIEQERPDALLTSLWPGGYGVFSPEIKNMIGKAKEFNPNCKVYSLSNDIPYLDWHWNDEERKVEEFRLVDKTFVRGDGSIKLNEFIPLDMQQMKKVHYVGHFINPLPPRTPMPDKDRKVLVTYGTRENQWNGDRNYSYFSRMMYMAPDTNLHEHPWDIVVGPSCPGKDYEALQKLAEQISAERHMQITVRRGVPDEKFRQEIADAAFRICQYDIFVLDDISTGIPALIMTGNLGDFTCGGREGEGRLYNLKDIGAPISAMDQNDIRHASLTISEINAAWKAASRRKKFSLPLNAPEEAADIMAKDFKLKDITAPDPVLSSANDVTPQVSPAKRAK